MTITMKTKNTIHAIIGTLAACLGVLLPAGALAHRPSFSYGEYGGPDSAFVVDDPDISIVIYHTLETGKEQLWLTFEAAAGDALFVQLATPVIERLRDYYPAMAILASGLPDPPDGLPFAVPDGLGAVVYAVNADTQVNEFYEPFTGTSSWIYVTESYTLPEAGKGYIVGWDPAAKPGKLWVGVGTVEDFSGMDMSQADSLFDQLATFHETEVTNPFAPTETDGSDAGAADAGTEHESGGAGSGCSALPDRPAHGPGSLLTLILRLLTA